jgi:hypothetical protein
MPDTGARAAQATVVDDDPRAAEHER